MAKNFSKKVDPYLTPPPVNSIDFKQKESILVVSNYKNDVEWVSKYTKNYLIYDKSEKSEFPANLDQNKVVKSPNVGYNLYDYFTYIIDNYNRLPERVLFVKGNVFPRHVSQVYFERLMNNTFFTPIEDYREHTENWPSNFFSSDGGFCEINNSWYLKIHQAKYFHSYNDFLKFCFKNPVIPRYIRFAPGANYIVPRENILKFPKIFYENLRTFVSYAKLPGEAHIMERALHTIWSSNFEVTETMLRHVDKIL